MDLMLNAAIASAKNRGVKYVHLGGGLCAGDGLSSFKKSLGGQSCAWFLGRSVLNEDAYKMLVREHAQNLGTDTQTLERATFFPLYRSRKQDISP